MNIKMTPSNQCTFVILGGTGDLSKRKLIPAIYNLIADKKIGQCALVAVSLTPTTIETILQQAQTFIPSIDQQAWKTLTNCAHYFHMDFHDTSKYPELCTLLTQVEQKHNLAGNRIFYLATMPNHFEVITQNLARHDIIKKKHESCDQLHTKTPWARVVYEKPFGFDLASSKKLNSIIAQAFCENQVFRIDHYLGKELVGNIALARFTNRIFEPLWNNKHIDAVHIIMSETIGIDGRGKFYDSCGAIKDMIQSHMLQIMSLIAIEPLARLTPNNIRDAKAKILKKIRVNTVQIGQYEGYRQEQHVNQESTTETFANISLFIDNKRWKKVPFHLKTGKYLKNREIFIKIIFKHVECPLDFCPEQPNYLLIRIQPDEGMSLGLNTKVPGQWNSVMPVTMDFCHSCLFGPNTPKAYETLLLDVIRSDHSAFLRADEITYSWKIVEKIIAKKEKLFFYPKGSSL